MGKKNKADNKGFVFSTDPNFKFEEETNDEQATLAPAKQLLDVKLDSKQRNGKIVTLVLYFTGKNADLEDLGKKIKNYCGTGGSVKDGEIIIQGDQRDKIMQYLQKNGYIKARRL
jgi:translation initiation factor 1